jgi:hypothetical protein
MSATLTMPERDAGQRADHPAIRPFRVEVPQVDLNALRRRLAMTQWWLEKATVPDSSQDVPLATRNRAGHTLERSWA